MKKLLSWLVVVSMVATLVVIPSASADGGFTLYPCTENGLYDVLTESYCTGWDGSWGTPHSAPYTLSSNDGWMGTLNGTNGTTEIVIESGSETNWSGRQGGVPAVKIKNGGAKSYVLYTPLSSLTSGKNTTVVYNHVGGWGKLDAVVTYDGGKTETVSVAPGEEYTLATAVTVTVGTFANVESVKIMRTDSSEAYIGPVEFIVEASGDDSGEKAEIHFTENVVTVSSATDDITGKLIIAQYSGNVLEKVKIFDISVFAGKDASETVPANFKGDIRAMVVSDLDSIRPLAPVASSYIE